MIKNTPDIDSGWNAFDLHRSPVIVKGVLKIITGTLEAVRKHHKDLVIREGRGETNQALMLSQREQRIP